MITNDDQIPVFSSCPRCGDRTLDVLKTHAYCVCCLFSPDLDAAYEESVPQWAIDIFIKIETSRNKNVSAPVAEEEAV